MSGLLVNALRHRWRSLRRVPVLRRAVALVEAERWARVLIASGEVDAEYVAAQLGRSTMSTREAARAYARGEFRRGVSVRPEFDEVYAQSRLPEGRRVPAFFSYLLNRSASAADATFRDPEAAPIQRDAALYAAREWAAGAAEIGDAREHGPHDGLTVILLAHAGDERLACRVRTAAAAGDRVLVVAAGVGASEWVLLAAEVARNHLVSARLIDREADPLSAVDDFLLHIARFVVVDSDVDVTVDDIRRLASRIRPGRVVVPVELNANGTIESAGAGVAGTRLHRILAGLPAEDLSAFGGEEFRVPLRANATFAGSGIPSAAAEVWVDPTVRIRKVVEPLRGGRRIMSGDDLGEIEAIYRVAGFGVDGWDGATPQLHRLATSTRWAIKVASLAGPVGDVWGDTHFGEALAEAFRRLGEQAVVDRREASNRDSAIYDDVHVIVRGPTRIHPPRHGVKVLWVISHPHEISADELSEFDLVFAASTTWARAATLRFGRPVFPLLECTDAERYKPQGSRRGTDVLFVGKSRDVPRRVVMAPIEAGIAVRVYGPDWAAFIPADAIVAPFVALSELPRMYESAGVVLNDQWAEMRDAGFPAMRPFDVIAAGGRVISEHVDGLREALGPGVITYREEAELISLLRRDDLDALFPNESVLRENAARVRREHSFDARAVTLVDAVSRFRESLDATACRNPPSDGR